jgi:hypothetical protein
MISSMTVLDPDTCMHLHGMDQADAMVQVMPAGGQIDEAVAWLHSFAQTQCGISAFVATSLI